MLFGRSTFSDSHMVPSLNAKIKLDVVDNLLKSIPVPDIKIKIEDV